MTDELRTSDLVVRFDEQRGVIQFLTRKASLQGMQILHEIRDEGRDPKEAIEHQVGQVILAYVSANYSSLAFGLEEYRHAGRTIDACSIDQSSESGSSEMDFENALLLLDRFDDSWTTQKLDEVEVLIKAAAANDSLKARSYLQDRWEQKRAVLVKRLSKQSGTK